MINMKSPISNFQSTVWRSFRMATWLGWQIESNWTDPFLFAVYSIVKPMASAMILVMMYAVITRGAFDSPLFPYIYLGNAFYIYVGAVMTGVSWSVIDDREHYRTLKYVYTAPISYMAYLIGRGVARIFTGSSAVLITITSGILFLRVPITITEIDFPLFLVTLVVGIAMLTMMGLLLAGVTLLTAHHAGYLGEATAGALYLFSGAIFPLDILPDLLRPIGFWMPITYWLELLRRSLVGSVAQAFPTLSGFSNVQLLSILFALTIVFCVLAFVVFRWCETRARDRGLIDRVTNH